MLYHSFILYLISFIINCISQNHNRAPSSYMRYDLFKLCHLKSCDWMNSVSVKNTLSYVFTLIMVVSHSEFLSVNISNKIKPPHHSSNMIGRKVFNIRCCIEQSGFDDTVNSWIYHSGGRCGSDSTFYPRQGGMPLLRVTVTLAGSIVTITQYQNKKKSILRN